MKMYIKGIQRHVDNYWAGQTQMSARPTLIFDTELFFNKFFINTRRIKIL